MWNRLPDEVSCYVGGCYTRSFTLLHIAREGKTAHERLKGTAYRGELVDFAERVTFMPVVLGDKINKLEVKWEPGRCIGSRPKSGEKLIMTREGIVKARTMRRLPVCDRWVLEDWEELKGVLWA